MLPDPNEYSSRTSIYGLYGFDERKQFYRCKIPADNSNIFFWSSGTWLIFVDSKAGKLNSSPLIKNDEDVLVGVVHSSNNLVFMRLGDEKWTNVEIDSFPNPSLNITSIHDLVIYKGEFYFVNQSGTVFVCHENVHAPHNHDRHIIVIL
ncbi:hypothetical protein Scep_023698 [Stephania cephalantha]|uniref:KIB1-4 beta-propeller domain-containing protein n=1 Tax=Stephania cephalantha TaxID=152367 RepID=A0AAP0F2A6_9MAGN